MELHASGTSHAFGAQLTAVPFYERLGYVSSGPVFVEAGIDHLRMDYVLR